MTDNTQELNEITSDLWVKYGRPGTMDEFVLEAKQAITSLIKELVKEAKPEKQNSEMVYSTWGDGYDSGIDEFEHNLLKELEEVI